MYHQLQLVSAAAAGLTPMTGLCYVSSAAFGGTPVVDWSSCNVLSAAVGGSPVVTGLPVMYHQLHLVAFPVVDWYSCVVV